jgi:hypothetical protein
MGLTVCDSFKVAERETRRSKAGRLMKSSRRRVTGMIEDVHRRAGLGAFEVVTGHAMGENCRVSLVKERVTGRLFECRLLWGRHPVTGDVEFSYSVQEMGDAGCDTEQVG